MMADYIRREAAILTVRRYAKNAIDKEVKELDVVDDVVNIVKELESVPAADVAEVVHGMNFANVRYVNIQHTLHGI